MHNPVSLPLQLWSIHDSQLDDSDRPEPPYDHEDEYEKLISPQSPHISLVTDSILKSPVLRISSPSLPNTYIKCPHLPDLQLGLSLPFLVFQLRNLDRFFSFEISVSSRDGKTFLIRSSNFQAQTRVSPLIATIPMRLDPGWNLLVFNIPDTVSSLFGSTYKETNSITVNASCHIRRIFFSDRLVSEDSLPPEFKLYYPTD
ncbi:Cilia- and flagella-associated protein 20 [Smittium mucronatum]|uniref:Cilia-and flagella-associated protein 20 n=1 Tax=Smittium mucronatum TaxID=133383 RepID=A0A1R0H2M3_9FUNG|nr:Cilia- and flagella-associated protein 20 [Smittium mucronatum]